MLSRFPPDIIDMILTSVDLKSLLSLTQVCKAIHVVFETHPNSIIHAVAENEIGPALPQALRLVRLPPGDVYDESEAQEISESLPEENDTLATRITRDEIVMLVQNANVVKALERLYSLRYKDIRNNSSQLTALESLRFHRALYRCWLFCRLFSLRHLDQDEYDEDDQQNSMNFLQRFSTPDLKAQEQVAGFLNETVWTMVSPEQLLHRSSVRSFLRSEIDVIKEGFDQSIIGHGPAMVLRCFEARSVIPFLPFADHRVVNALWTCILVALNGHSNTITSNTGRCKVILDEIRGEFDQCDECHSQQGLSLWCSSNCHLIGGAQLIRFLPGNLSRNSTEVAPLLARLNQTPFSIYNFIEECAQTDTNDLFGEKALCIVCLRKVWGEHLLRWLIQEKVSNNNPPVNDCWYGWDCRTQIHKPAHAAKLNHLCKATRGDPA